MIAGRDVTGLPLFMRAPSPAGSATSREAAVSIVPDLSRLEALVLDALVLTGGAAEFELEARLKLSGNTVRPRIRTLVMIGAARDSGRTRTTPSGRKAIVWEAT